LAKGGATDLFSLQGGAERKWLRGGGDEWESPTEVEGIFFIRGGIPRVGENDETD